jgi:hypothetical protein
MLNIQVYLLPQQSPDMRAFDGAVFMTALRIDERLRNTLNL